MWSHQARCIKLQNGDDRREDLEPTEFCAFTNSSFASSRGISLITTPEIANEILSAPAFIDPEHEDEPQHDSTSFYVSELPGRGMGVIVNNTISSGDLIMSRKPAFVVHDAALQGMSREDLAPLLDSAFEQLGAEMRASVMGLHAQHAEDRDHIVRSIIVTNSFSFEGLGRTAQGHAALFPEVSRFNHDCRPK
ncbi:hypothetical protein ACHAQH_007748 [Verticillium albo-atrum]